MNGGTTRFQDVLYGAADLCGLTPGITLSKEHAASLTRSINRALGEAWIAFEWPQLTRTEERAYATDWDSGITFAQDDIAHDPEGGYFISLADGNAGNPLTDTDFWEPYSVLARTIRLSQNRKPLIGAVLSVHDADPLGKVNAPRRDFRVTAELIVLATDAPDTVWLRYRIPRPVLTTDEWAESASYAAGEIRYAADDGDCYRCIADVSTGDYPPLSEGTWEKLEIPADWQHFLELRTAAYYLIADGKAETAADLRAEAGAALMQAMADAANNQSQVRPYKAA